MERDPDDNRVLEAAVAGSADFIVSGDKALRARERYEGIEIITPARFLGIMCDLGTTGAMETAKGAILGAPSQPRPQLFRY